MQIRNEKVASDVSVTRHKVRDAIQQKIFQGKYETGSRLPQVHLAREFNVSQSVIRESLLELRAMGMVELKDQLGAFVREVDSRKLLQAYEIREMLEGLAARLCCDRASRAELRDLDRMAERMRTLPPEQAQMRYPLDREFHQRIVHLSRNDMLIQFSESYQILGKVVKVNEKQDLPPDEHHLLLKPILDNQPDEAERRMREHIQKGRRGLEQKIADGTFRWQWVD
ncbi:MAG: GntR family transcriptional regulator [Phycisphaerae bacterium]|nr:GntR family transcriptional regulator [Phycisphaerae bacterium]